MKKLMTMLAAVGMAFGLFAEEPAAVTGGAYAKTSIEAGETDPFPTGWVKAADDDSAAATFEETGVEDSSEAYTAKSVRYAGFVPGNLSFLQVKNSLTGTPLYYNIGAEAQAIEDNVCFDTLIQFTEGCDDDPAVNADAKIAVWLKTTDAADLEPGVEAETNLYITAGIVENNEIVQHNFLVADSGIEPGSWHRVTIRTIANVLSDTPALPGFLVYIDGNIVSGGDLYNDLSLNTAADRFAGKGQLFVSAAGKGAATIQSIGFAGRGYADDISVTWGDQVPTFAFPATDAKIVAAEGLVSFQYKVNDATEYTTVTVGEDDYVFQVMDGDIVYFNEGEGGFVFAQSEEKAYTKGDITPSGFQYDEEAGGYKFSGADTPSLTIGVVATDFEVVLRAPNGDFITGNTAAAVLNYLNTPEGKTFVGTVNFMTDVIMLKTTIPDGSELTIGEGGVWTFDVAEDGRLIYGDDIENGKTVTINGNVVLSGTIKGADPEVETTVTVNGGCRIGEDGLIVGDDSDGKGAALIIGVDGLLTAGEAEDCGIITLGANGRVVVPEAVTVEDVFTDAPTGKKIVDAMVTGGVQYSLANLAAVQVTVVNVNNGAKIDGVETGSYIEGQTVTFTVEPDTENGYETPITVTVTGADPTENEDEYTFTVGTTPITITVTATLKQVTATFKDGESVVDTQVIDWNTAPTNVVLSKAHFRFNGWDNDPVIAIKGDTTYLAQWQEDVKFDVTFTTNNLPMADKTINVYTGTTLTADDLPTVEGGTWDVDPVGAVITCATNFNYTIAAPAPDPVIDPTKPDEPAVVKAATKEDAEAAVKISVPADVASDVSEETYQAYFTKTAVETSEGSGEWNVTAKLSDTVVKAEAETTDVAAKLSDIAAAETATSITIENAKPGLYYSLVEGSTLEDRAEGARAKATSAGVTLQATHYEGSGFYQIKVSTTAE